MLQKKNKVCHVEKHFDLKLIQHVVLANLISIGRWILKFPIFSIFYLTFRVKNNIFLALCNNENGYTNN